MMDQLYDIAIVGGGLAGSALAKSMAEKRFRVIVLEREKDFRDRVRGEQMACWGVAEARELGIYEHLVNGACGQEVRWWETRLGSTILGRRDFLKTTPQQMPQFMFYHPRMQEILASAAQAAGVEYRRGITVSGLETESRQRFYSIMEGRQSGFRHDLSSGLTAEDLPCESGAGLSFGMIRGVGSSRECCLTGCLAPPLRRHISTLRHPSGGRSCSFRKATDGHVHISYIHMMHLIGCREQLTFQDSLMNPCRWVFQQSFTPGRALPALSHRLTVQITGLSIPTATESRSSEMRPRLMTHASGKDYHSLFVM
jgi:hypothetical protein